MKLPDLLGNIATNVPNIEITGITSDSRKIKSGYLFVSLSKNADKFISGAINKGAAAVITGQQNKNDNRIFVQNPKEVYHRIASRFYTKQPKNIVAVTGTNGKTSVVNFCQQLWNSANIKSASIGTIGVQGNIEKKYKINLTTPDAGDMHKILYDLASEGINYVAVEASSHGIEQYRMHGVNLHAAGFTNISQDHYDYHHDFASYFQAKQKLFLEILPENKTAVLNNDISEYHDLINKIKTQKIISYGNQSQDIKTIKQTPKNNGQVISLCIYGNKKEVFLPILGKFQVYNILCAIGLVTATGIENFDLSALKGVNGRMQPIEKNGHRVVIDYAHTPDALKSALTSLRWHMINKGRVILVFGCGGERDKSKRKTMGKIAADHADVTIVCDDNPRNENPDLIRKEIISSCNKAINISDRKKAIIAAINEAKSNDIILIAGKGHEESQINGSQVIFFNDFLTVSNILS
ncbi:MAG: UDP-N-acetylmuramoyl-L-alanyl-D-glutamate--2,6-diaminopimelate ligase [Rickettsiaceae bacterium H1]|nr:UDP-N-acetylmuramoyl-L-alanyl-D-glutamate--2,6-diaminopimelate ligase [Rickettsiaceae bacterium H1]